MTDVRNDRTSQTTVRDAALKTASAKYVTETYQSKSVQEITRLRGDVKQLAEVCREQDRRIDELEETLRRLRANIDDVVPTDCQERP